MEASDFDLLIKHEINNVFIVKPTFQKYAKVDETYRNLVKLSTPDEDRLDNYANYLGKIVFHIQQQNIIFLGRVITSNPRR